MSSRGGRRPGSGRKRIYDSSSTRIKVWQRGHRRMWLDSIIYSSWISAKLKCGYASDSAFAGHLLSLEQRRRESERNGSACEMRKRAREEHREDVSDGPLTSTPVQSRARNKRKLSLQESPLKHTMSPNESVLVDITGLSGAEEIHSVANSSYKIQNNSVIVSRESMSSSSSSEQSDDDMPFFGESERLDEALCVLNQNHELDESESEEEQTLWEEYFEGGSEGQEGEDELDASLLQELPSDTPTSEQENQQPVTLVSNQLEETVSQIQKSSKSVMIQTDQINNSTRPSVPKHVPEYGPHQKFSRKDEEQQYQEELGLIKGTKVICSLDLLVQQLGGGCQHPGCIHDTKVDYTLCGTSAMIRCKCPAGHMRRFCTSGEVNNVMSTNFQAAAAVLLSGNNFSKIEKFAAFMGLSFISRSTFYRVQKLYCIPAIEEWWQWMRGELVVEFKNEELVVSGDGQCDSPGFSAKNLCYYLMEVVTEYILEVEVLDKRHVGMKSSTMERKALNNSLERLKNLLTVTEVCTDASSSIKKLMAEDFKDVFHSLDVWHKAKSIRKCIQKVAATKGNEKIAEWSDAIINHFWYCCSVASECNDKVNATAVLKNKWLGLLHHVCDDHEWTGGQCAHGDLNLDDQHPPWFDRRDKDFNALQKVILEPTLLESFKYYVRFRHTGSLECANSMSLGYTPKRCSYTYQVYKARRQLAVIDWNYHVNRATATNENNEARHTRKYNQRTKEWNTRVVKVSKDFGYIPILMAKIFKLRFEDLKPIDRHVSLSEDDPARIAPTIAEVPPVSSKELYTRHQSRFLQCKTNSLTAKHSTETDKQ